MIKHWRSAEERHGIALPVRVAAALCAGESRFMAGLAAASGAAGAEIGTANLLLWPRGGEIRLGALQSHNPFRAAAVTDAALARVMFQWGEPDWYRLLVEELARGGVARITSGPKQTRQLRGEVVRLLAEPINSGYLRLYPTVEGLRHLPNGGVAVELSVREKD
jgi:hypothetical protein